METDKKKILVVDDSPLMRRVLSDIINSDRRFQVCAKAVDGIEAFDLLSRESFDAVVLDLNMPKMGGLELLSELRKYRIAARVMIASTDSAQGAQVTLDALELGALDFIQKPGSTFECRGEDFTQSFLGILYAVACSSLPAYDKPPLPVPKRQETIPPAEQRQTVSPRGIRKIVAIASSTGGPRALLSVIPQLPKDLDAPVVMVQHMPAGFTASFAERLDHASGIEVREAKDREVLEKGVVYVAMSGRHMNIDRDFKGNLVVRYSDEARCEGVRPSANYMFSSLGNIAKLAVTCVVLTGMGSDGTDGIRVLKEKKKDVFVITQDAESCVIYGMPKSVVNAGLSDASLSLEFISNAIEDKVGRLT